MIGLVSQVPTRRIHTMRVTFASLLLLTPLFVLGIESTPAQDKAKKDAGYVAIFDGKTLSGWHVSAQTGHSRASKNKTGGRWFVENGVMLGSQDIPGNGGIIITDKMYKNFEVVLEMNNDFGPDSRLFLRSNEKGQAYQ